MFTGTYLKMFQTQISIFYLPMKIILVCNLWVDVDKNKENIKLSGFRRKRVLHPDIPNILFLQLLRSVFTQLSFLNFILHISTPFSKSRNFKLLNYLQDGGGTGAGPHVLSHLVILTCLMFSDHPQKKYLGTVTLIEKLNKNGSQHQYDLNRESLQNFFFYLR